MTRATDELFDQLHGMQAEQLRDYLKKVRDGEADFIPAMFAQINKFLKDNGIDRPLKVGDPTDLLADELEEFDSDNVSPFRKSGS